MSSLGLLKQLPPSIGVVFERNGVEIGIVSGCGDLIATRFIDSSSLQFNPGSICIGIARYVRRLLRSEQLGNRDISGMGVSFPGLVMRDGMILTVSSRSKYYEFMGMNLRTGLGLFLRGMKIYVGATKHAHRMGILRFGEIKGKASSIVGAASLVE